MKVVLFAPYAIFAPHFETELEIAEAHLQMGDSVEIVVCTTDLLACDPNMYHDISVCALCIRRRSIGLPLLSKRVTQLPLLHLTAANRKELQSLPVRFDSLQDLFSYQADDFDIGSAVASSLISRFREPDLDVRQHAPLIERLIHSAYAVYRSMQNILTEREIDHVYCFNGRMAPMRAALRACQSRQVDCSVHERGCDIHHYALYHNTYPHDLAHIDTEIRRYWKMAEGDARRETIGSQFFLDKARGIEYSWFSFVSKQNQGLLPDNWNPQNRNIVIFTSSEDEFVGLGAQWHNRIYDRQVCGLQRILADSRRLSPSTHLYVRVHPNMTGIRNSDSEILYGLSGERLTVIPAQDPVSSYALLQAADMVLTFGSTVGIEAVYWGKPSILAGASFYQGLGGTYNPDSHDELVSMLRADLTPKSKEAALMYGYYSLTFGVPFRYYAAEDLFRGTFNGERVEPGLGFRGARALLKHTPFVCTAVSELSLRRITKGMMP